MKHSIRNGQKFTLSIEDLNLEGQGVAHIEGVTAFVDGALPGETAEVEICRTAPNYVAAQTLSISRKSPQRVEPFCPVYAKCGGCTLQHLDYAEQLKYKTRQTAEILRRVGGLTDIRVMPAEGMTDLAHYRNKAQFPVTSHGIGFYAKRSHEVADASECPVSDRAADLAREVVRGFMRDHGIRPYDETAGTGLIRHLIVRTAFGTGEVMVVVVINGNRLPAYADLGMRLNAAIPGFKTLVMNINHDRSNIITGHKTKILYGDGFITDVMDGISFRISPLSFYQVNSAQALKIYRKVVELAALNGSETIVDLYCGIGTISLFLARHAARVIGVENVAEAVEAATLNASINHVENASFLAADASQALADLCGEGMRPDLVTVDPPRAGCAPELLATIAEMDVPRLIYVSCNPATLARDLKILAADGYKPGTVFLYDMFPQTGHVECVVLMSRV